MSELTGVVSMTFLTTVLVFTNVLLLWGLYFFPTQVGLGFLLPYATYVLVLGRQETTSGAPWNWFRLHSPLIVSIRKFLNIKIVWNDELVKADQKQDAQFIFAAFPHGSNADYRILVDGMFAEKMPNTFVRLRALAATVLFRIPLVREISLWTSCVDANRKVANHMLGQGLSLWILPGGQAEQMRTIYGRERIYLSRRKGFIRLALEHNVPVIPMYVFGCSDYYKTSNWGISFRLALLKYTGMALPIAFGWNGHLLCPRAVKTTVVMGAPMYFNGLKDGKSRMSKDERIDAAHALFSEALQKLFNTHKKELGYGDRELEIL